jgi:hypothetical protein
MPVFEGLIVTKDGNSAPDKIVQDLLWTMNEWYALAAMRLHTDTTITRLKEKRKSLGQMLRRFANTVCPLFKTKLLPREVASQARRRAAGAAKRQKQAAVAPPPSTPTPPPPPPPPKPAAKKRGRPRKNPVPEPEPEPEPPTPPVPYPSPEPEKDCEPAASVYKQFTLTQPKIHFLAYYEGDIEIHGPCPAYSTQTVCLAATCDRRSHANIYM